MKFSSTLSLTFALLFAMPAWASPKTDDPKPLKPGTVTIAYGHCSSELAEAKIYVNPENVLQERTSILVSMTLKNAALRQSYIMVAEGEYVLNEQAEQFQYVVTFEDEELGRFKLVQRGEDLALVGTLTFEEDNKVECR